jgi:hypothetical protein
VIITHLEFEILIEAPTFHCTTIIYENFKIRNLSHKAIDILNDPTMNKIMGATTVNQHHDCPMFDVALYFNCLRRKNTHKGMERYDRLLRFHKICDWIMDGGSEW